MPLTFEERLKGINIKSLSPGTLFQYARREHLVISDPANLYTCKNSIVVVSFSTDGSIILNGFSRENPFIITPDNILGTLRLK